MIINYKKATSRKIFYVFDCGCTVEKKNIILRKGVRRCPKHLKANLIKRFSNCVDCGVKLVNTTGKGDVPRRCKKHTKIRDKRHAKRNKTRYQKKEDLSLGKLPPKRRPDCKWYFSHCLQLGGKLLRNPNACESCQRYEYQAHNGIYVKLTTKKHNFYARYKNW